MSASPTATCCEGMVTLLVGRRFKVLAMPLPCLLAWESSKKSTRNPKGYEMKYLCLIYQDESVALKLPRAEAEKIHGDYLAFTDEIKKSGCLLGNQGLQPTQTAITVRVRNGKVTATDGPFAETKEQLGGYFLIEASDLNEAIQIAAKIPSAGFGSIEVRPVWE